MLTCLWIVSVEYVYMFVDRIDMFMDHYGSCWHIHRSFGHACVIMLSLWLLLVSVTLMNDVYRFVQCTHQRMNHITPAESDEIVNIICSARNAFYMTPGGLVQFNELLQSLRRTKSCKKDLWQRIVNGLASGSV